MRKRYWLLALCTPFWATSCGLYEDLFGDFVVQKTPDTLVLSIDPEQTEVQYLENDSIYNIVRYWMDVNGNRLYKSLESPYKRGRLHGTQQIWNKAGLLIHTSNWDEGVRVDSLVEWYDNQRVKKYIQYSRIGNKEFEMNFHPNGRKSTDTIQFNTGKLNGEVSEYDSLGKITNTYTYRNDTLVGAQVFKAIYTELEGKGARLAAKRAKELADAAKDTMPKNVVRIEDDTDW